VVSAAVFFFLGRRLNLFGKHWLNFLSVSGSFVCSIFVVVIFTIVLPVDVFIIFALPFSSLPRLIGPVLSPFISDVSAFFTVVFMPTIFPSIVIWLGMVHKVRQVNKEKESDACSGEGE